MTQLILDIVSNISNSKEMDNLSHKDHGLRFAAKHGYCRQVRILLSRGADPNLDNDYCLRQALKFHHDDVVKILGNRVISQKSLYFSFLYDETYVFGKMLEFYKKEDVDDLLNTHYSALKYYEKYLLLLNFAVPLSRDVKSWILAGAIKHHNYPVIDKIFDNILLRYYHIRYMVDHDNLYMMEKLILSRFFEADNAQCIHTTYTMIVINGKIEMLKLLHQNLKKYSFLCFNDYFDCCCSFCDILRYIQNNSQRSSTFTECLYYFITELYQCNYNHILILSKHIANLYDKYWTARIAKYILYQYPNLDSEVRGCILSPLFERYKDFLLLSYPSDILYLVLRTTLSIL